MKKRSKTPYKQDPNAVAEAEKYDNPIPSREFILQCLEDSGKPISRDQFIGLFNMQGDEDQIEALRRRLRAMERDGQIVYTRRGFAPVSKLDLIKGRIIGHRDGFGFLQPDQGGDDLFLSARQMSNVMHGDRVVAHITGFDKRGRPEGAIVEVLERAHQQVVGRFHSDSGVCFVEPDNKRLSQDIIIPSDKAAAAKAGQFVVAAIIQYPGKGRRAIGEIIEILGDHMAPGMEIDVAMRSYGIPVEWPQAVHDDVSDLNPQVAEADKKGRLDLRDKPLVTIDGEDARDFDDAVLCEPTPSGWRLTVAIADVSHYVAPKTALDAEALERGNSVYFPERVIPMLPEILSNGLCSLNPDVDRLCMVCEILIDSDGQIRRSSFHEAVMRSHQRFTYTQVASILVDRDAALREQHADLVPHLEHLHDLYQALRDQRRQRGAIDFDTEETRIVFSADRKIEQIVPLQRNEAHMLIEECMIAANICAARFLLRHKIPGLFRVHESPDAEKVSDLREFLGTLGLQLKGGEVPEARHYAELLNQVQGHVDYHLIQTVMLRSLKQAQYYPENDGHFGLALEAYAHFTSPIRRYPDLLVHRAIRHILRHRNSKRFPYNHDMMIGFGEHCSMTDRRADEATRDVVSWLKCEYMQDKVGDEFDGVISSVTSFGLFVELNDIFVEGLVHVTDLDSDYYHFEPAGHRMVGERTGQVYRLGDAVRIRIVRVNLDDRKIDFVLLAHTPSKPAAGPGKGRKTGKKKSQSRHQQRRKKTGAKKKQASGENRGQNKSAASTQAPKSKKKTAKRTGKKRSQRRRQRT